MPLPHRIILTKHNNPINCLTKFPNDSSTFSWNSLLRFSPPHQTLSLYSNMLQSKIYPNKFTFTFLIKACNKILKPHLGIHLHSHLIKFGFGSDAFLQSSLIGIYAEAGLITIAQKLFDKMSHRDIVSWTALVSAYAKCGMPDDARRVFDEMPERNAVSWAAVVAGYSQSGRHEEALRVFNEMRCAKVKPTEAMLVSVLSSSGHLGVLEVGKWVHDYVEHEGIPLTASMGTALLSMYSKCGCVDNALQIFKVMPRWDELGWTAMISALSMHGRGREALALFEEMVSLRLRPDYVTLVGVLSACSHAGLVNEGCHYFRCMKEVYKISPGVEHYGCMVDILGRGGRIEEAWDLIRNMPMNPDAFVFKSLLSACTSYGNLDCAEWAAKKLIELNQDSGTPYILLGNVYARVGRWADAERVRKTMRVRRIEKTAGYSLVEVDEISHHFVAGNNEEQPNIEEIKSLLQGMNKMLGIADNACA